MNVKIIRLLLYNVPIVNSNKEFNKIMILGTDVIETNHDTNLIMVQLKAISHISNGDTIIVEPTGLSLHSSLYRNITSLEVSPWSP